MFSSLAVRLSPASSQRWWSDAQQFDEQLAKSRSRAQTGNEPVSCTDDEGRNRLSECDDMQEKDDRR